MIVQWFQADGRPVSCSASHFKPAQATQRRIFRKMRQTQSGATESVQLSLCSSAEMGWKTEQMF